MEKTRRKIGKRILSALMLMALIFTMLPSVALNVEAAEESITFGQTEYNISEGYLKYGFCTGTGTKKYKSLVVNFTSSCANGERIELPTSVSGFTVNTNISNNVTKAINFPEGKTLIEIASYIRKIKFYNCDKSDQNIKFTVGSNIVEFLTLYCEATGHYYQYVPFKSSGANYTGSLSTQTYTYGSWPYAYYTALEMEYEGLPGYLVTYGDYTVGEDEDAFLYLNAAKVGWLGGTRMRPGESATTAKGIKYFKSFTTSGTDFYHWWYWASGPDAKKNDGKFMNYDAAYAGGSANSNSKWGYYSNVMSTVYDTNHFYVNWGTNEPNGVSGTGENCMTTLRTNTGYVTGNTAKLQKAVNKTPANAYSWNDIIYDNWQVDGGKETYKSMGFFVEYGQDATTDAAQFTGHVEETETKALTHDWAYIAGSGTDSNTVYAYCRGTGGTVPKCSFYGTESLYPTSLSFSIDINNKAYDGNAIGAAIISSSSTAFKAGTEGTIASVKYYKTSKEGATTGGTEVNLADLKEIGYYYAEATATVTNASTTHNVSSATAVKAFKIYKPDADFEVETLNNLGDGDSAKATRNKATHKVVWGNSEEALKTQVATLNVHLTQWSDDVALVKLAELDSSHQPAWIDKIKGKGTSSDADYVEGWLRTTNGSKYASYSTPTLLGSAPTSTQTLFFETLKNDYIGEYSTLTGASPKILTQYVHASDKTRVLAEDRTTVVDRSDDATKQDAKVIQYQDIPFGTYAIIAKNGNSAYSISVVNIFPQQGGPKADEYFVEYTFDAYLKESSANVEKYVTGPYDGGVYAKETDAAIDDKVTFKVNINLPTYKDRENISNTRINEAGENVDITTMNNSGYYLNVVDTMAPGYTIVDNSIKLYYQVGEADPVLLYQQGTTTTGQLPSNTAYAFYASGTAGVTGTSLTTENRATYTDEAAIENGAIAVARTGCFFSVPTVVKSASNTENATAQQLASATTITIDFDEPLLRKWKAMKTGETTLHNTNNFILEYEATLDKDATAGTEDNYNKVVVNYEKDSTGRITSANDKVYTYTYGLNLIKLDGKDDSPLADAKFELYREVAQFETATGNAKYAIIEPDAFSSTTFTNLEEAKTALKTGSKPYTGNYTHAITVVSGTDGSKEASQKNVVGLFVKYTNTVGKFNSDGVITSIADSNGLFVTGLSRGNYILTETAAPSTYNTLAEDIYFEINALEDFEEEYLPATLMTMREQNLGDGITKYKAILEAKANNDSTFNFNEKLTEKDASENFYLAYNSTGFITLTVLNYQGLTLPSTGGIGILIFVIIGTALMAFVIFFILYKRRNEMLVEDNNQE